MHINNSYWMLLLCSIFFLNACGSSSGSGSSSRPGFDMRGDWLMTARHEVGYTEVPITITAHNRATGKFRGKGEGVDDELHITGSVKWQGDSSEGSRFAVIEMRMFGGAGIFCPFKPGSTLGRSYPVAEAYYVYNAEERPSIGPESYAPHTAYVDTTARHRYQCSELSAPVGSVGHVVSISFVRTKHTDEDMDVDDSLYKIGDSGPAGGIVYYVAEDGIHGLEAAPEDQPAAAWGCYGDIWQGARGLEIGTGFQNTETILANCMDTPIAADRAAGYTLNGFSDWHLPSLHELRELFLQKDIVGGFADGNYWSSTQYDYLQAVSLSFGDGYQHYPDKDLTGGVRAIRAF